MQRIHEVNPRGWAAVGARQEQYREGIACLRTWYGSSKAGEDTLEHGRRRDLDSLMV